MNTIAVVSATPSLLAYETRTQPTMNLRTMMNPDVWELPDHTKRDPGNGLVGIHTWILYTSRTADDSHGVTWAMLDARDVVKRRAATQRALATLDSGPDVSTMPLTVHMHDNLRAQIRSRLNLGEQRR